MFCSKRFRVCQTEKGKAGKRLRKQAQLSTSKVAWHLGKKLPTPNAADPSAGDEKLTVTFGCGVASVGQLKDSPLGESSLLNGLCFMD